MENIRFEDLPKGAQKQIFQQFLDCLGDQAVIAATDILNVHFEPKPTKRQDGLIQTIVKDIDHAQTST